MATALERSRFAIGACALCVVSALGLATPSAAHGYEDKAGIALDLGYAHATERSSPHNGGLVGLEASLGLDDIWTLRGALTYSLHPGSSSLSVLALSGELLYLIDVLELVPYFGAGIDAIGSFAAHTSFTSELGVHPVVGIDWLLARNFALGLQGRPIFLITAWNRAPIYVSVNLNATWLLDL